MASPIPAVTRSNSKGPKGTPPPPLLTLQDFRKLLAESEARVISKVNEKFDALMTKVSALESSISEIKAVQTQQEMNMDAIRDVIASQQRQIEAFDARERRCNLIVSNVPENTVTFDKEELGNDTDKFLALANEILPGSRELVSAADISEVVRLGQPGKNPRVLKVKLHDEDLRNDILRSGKNLGTASIRTAFGAVYVNKDLSLLRRQEERRLRLKRRELKNKFPDADVHIKNGKLYLGPAIRDQVDFRNQLF